MTGKAETRDKAILLANDFAEIVEDVYGGTFSPYGFIGPIEKALQEERDAGYRAALSDFKRILKESGAEHLFPQFLGEK